MPDTILVIPDATEADGSPYEAAGAALDAVTDAADALRVALARALVLARNAELSRQIEFELEPSVPDWEQTLTFKRLTDAVERTIATQKALRPVRQAAAYDPKDYTP